MDLHGWSGNFVHSSTKSLSATPILFFLFCHNAGKSCSALTWTQSGNTSGWKKWCLFFPPDFLSIMTSLILSIIRLYDYGCWHTNGMGAGMSIWRKLLMQQSFALWPHNSSSLKCKKSEVVLILLLGHAFPLFWWPWWVGLKENKPHYKKWGDTEWLIEYHANWGRLVWNCSFQWQLAIWLALPQWEISVQFHSSLSVSMLELSWSLLIFVQLSSRLVQGTLQPRTKLIKTPKDLLILNWFQGPDMS